MQHNTQLVLNYIKSNIESIKQDANNSIGCEVFSIALGNTSITISPNDKEEFLEEIEKIQKDNDVLIRIIN